MAIVAPGLIAELPTRAWLWSILDAGSTIHEDMRSGGGPNGTLTRKLRTMYMFEGQEAVDPHDLLTLNNPRIPKGAGIVRRARLDELPQVRDVLKGKMSFVGIRPVTEKYREEIREQVGLVDRLRWDRLLKSQEVPAGMTSLASVAILRQRANDIEDYAPLRVENDLRYAQEFASLRNDAIIVRDSIVLAAAAVVRRSVAAEVVDDEVQETAESNPLIQLDFEKH